MNMCRSQFFTGILLLLQPACLLTVHGAPAPVVTLVNLTRSCCGELNITITKGCLNRFLHGNTVLAQVEGTKVNVMEPFQYFEDEGVMQIQKCVDFTHSIICEVDARHVSEERIYNKLTPCAKEDNPPNAAIQGSKFSILLCVVLLMIFSYGWF